MKDPHEVLGLPADSDDDAIRSRYLELVRQFPPEQEPARFAEVRAAYEHFQDRDTRLLNRLSRPYRKDALDGLVDRLAASAARPRFGLSDLLKAHRAGD
jgi:curved DNA-binding protein CbpA